jgi:transposase-like protein
MHRSKMPLTIWFWAAYLVTTHTPGLSALQFARQLNLRYETAFQMLHRLRAAMVKDGREQLRGEVEVDETFIGGERVRAHGTPRYGKAVVVGAVEVRGKGSGRVRLQVIRSNTTEQLVPFIRGAIEAGSTVITDGWGAYDRLADENYRHEKRVERTSQRAGELLPRIHFVFSNLKTWLLGTHHGSVKKQHLQAYLNEFTFRFNRRRVPMAAFQTVLGLASQRLGPTYRGLYGVVQGSREWQHPNPIAGGVGRRQDT